MENGGHYEKIKERAQGIFAANSLVYCPYFKTHITLNSDGFHHLQYSNRRERNKNEQCLKFSLLPLALKVIKTSGTIQEYRTGLVQIGKRGADGFMKTKNVEYWGLEAIIGENKIKIRVILRRIGDGKIIFWSVMPTVRLNCDRVDLMRSLARKGIEED